MADTGWLTPATSADDTAVGTIAWTLRDNGRAEDAVVMTDFADTGGTVANHISYYAKMTNFSAGVPSGATINGIEVQMKKLQTSAAGSNCSDNSVKLSKGGTIQGTEKNIAGAWPSLTLQWVAYGGATDMWGLSLSDTDVNATTFGVGLAANVNGGARPGIAGQVNVDSIQIKVYYTEAAPTFIPKVMIF